MKYTFSKGFSERVAECIGKNIEKQQNIFHQKILGKDIESFRAEQSALRADFRAFKKELGESYAQQEKALQNGLQSLREANQQIENEMNGFEKIGAFLEILRCAAWTAVPLLLLVMILWGGMYAMVKEAPETPILKGFFGAALVVVGILGISFLIWAGKKIVEKFSEAMERFKG